MLIDFKSLENTLHINLEGDYIKLLASNRVDEYTEKNVNYINPLINKNLKTSISTFFCPTISNSGGLLLEEDFYAPEELTGNRIIPFGMDAGGYLFCFDYRKSDIPSIVLWIRDNPEGEDIADLAINFEEFLKKLESEKG